MRHKEKQLLSMMRQLLIKKAKGKQQTLEVNQYEWIGTVLVKRDDGT